MRSLQTTNLMIVFRSPSNTPAPRGSVEPDGHERTGRDGREFRQERHNLTRTDDRRFVHNAIQCAHSARGLQIRHIGRR